MTMCRLVEGGERRVEGRQGGAKKSGGIRAKMVGRMTGNMAA